jgi:hypothetical protein
MKSQELLKAELQAMHSSHELEHGLDRLAGMLSQVSYDVRAKAGRARELAIPVAVAATVLGGIFAAVVITLRRRRARRMVVDERVEYLRAS